MIHLDFSIPLVSDVCCKLSQKWLNIQKIGQLKKLVVDTNNKSDLPQNESICFSISFLKLISIFHFHKCTLTHLSLRHPTFINNPKGKFQYSKMVYTKILKNLYLFFFTLYFYKHSHLVTKVDIAFLWRKCDPCII